MSSGGFFDVHGQLSRRRGAVPPPDVPPNLANAISVSELTSRIDRALKVNLPDTLLVRGEVSNFRIQQGSGHYYFTLKDASSCVDCVMWKDHAARLKFAPADGMELLATGRVTVYRERGKYQLSVVALRPLGKGALEVAFQQLRARLGAQGLFDPAAKKALPRYPQTIVLITGANTAALQDMLKVLRRFGWLRLVLGSVPVQGEGAAEKIAAAIHHVNRAAGWLAPDVLILARGGGSLEDLWSFNEEVVARAIAASQIPVVTGIGHEVDTTIADLVADYHAHTPTEAAQVVSAGWRDARQELDGQALHLRRALINRLHDSGQRLALIERHEIFRRPFDRLNLLRQRLDDRQRQLESAMHRRLQQTDRKLRELGSRLDRRLPALIARVKQTLAERADRLLPALARRIRLAHAALGQLGERLSQAHPRATVRLYRQRLKTIEERLARDGQAMLNQRRQALEAAGRQLESVNPINVLRRGYTITTRKKDGQILRAAAQVKPGDRLITRTADGTVESTADDPRQPGLFD